MKDFTGAHETGNIAPAGGKGSAPKPRRSGSYRGMSEGNITKPSMDGPKSSNKASVYKDVTEYEGG